MVKRIVLVAVLAFICISSGFAQQKIELSIEAGPNFGNIIQHESNEYESNFGSGFQGGVGLIYRINPKVHIQTGVGFSQVNLSRDYDSDPYQREGGPQLPAIIPMDYEFMLIDVPVEAGYSLRFGDVEAGFQGSLRPTFVTAVNNERYLFRDEDGVAQLELDISDEMKSFILMGEAGVQIRYSLDENTSAFGGFKAGYDLTGIQKNNAGNGHLFRAGFTLGLAISLF
ncbi:outer membrane beta-barrel protein [Gracilimonas sediminicola]|uniref:PorT family protein n=1 Tax=Gracilimonas sediminicola TaxID=2952158 RepID=A0A9X2L4U7_9BACT|nr:PorT family protein [Gracilimonas sediminicola]